MTLVEMQRRSPMVRETRWFKIDGATGEGGEEWGCGSLQPGGVRGELVLRASESRKVWWKGAGCDVSKSAEASADGPRDAAGSKIDGAAGPSQSSTKFEEIRNAF